MKIIGKLGFILCMSLIIVTMSQSGCELLDDDIDPPPSANVGDTLWVHDNEAEYFISGTLALGLDGSVYYAEGGGTAYWHPTRIVALNKEDGSVKWRSSELDHWDISSLIVVDDDGIVYVIGLFTLYAISPADGQFLWTWEVPETVPNPDGGYPIYTKGQIGSLALTSAGDLVLASIGSGVYARALYCISNSGTTQWYNLDANQWGVIGGIFVGHDDNLFYYAMFENYKLMSVHAPSGAIRWSRSIWGVGSSTNNILIDDNGTLIASFAKNEGDTHHLHRIDPANGNVLWSSAGESSIRARWMGPDGVVYEYFALDYGLHRFDMQSGERTRFFSDLFGNQIGSINNQNQLIIVMSTNEWGDYPKLRTINMDGSEDWRVEMIGMRPMPLLISGEKVIYGIIDQLGQIFAIQGNAPIASSGWPRPSHDNRNTFNVGKH